MASKKKSTYKVISRDLPAIKRNVNGYSGRYPFAVMKVGNCFYLARKETANSVRQCAASYVARHAAGAKFSVRKDEGGAYACYRIK